MNVLFIMLKLLHEVESKLAYRVLRVIRGTLGYARDATVDDIQVVHDSFHYVVVNKHHDVIINHKDKNSRVTVEKQLERLYPDLVNPKLRMSFFFCHRLDYATSGILCIAKHKEACSAAAGAFSSRKSQKFYIALVRGHLSQNFLTVREGVGEDLRESFRGIRMAVASSPFCAQSWRKATTHMAVLERGYCWGYPATKILMRPIEGRRHQLRVHCSTVGHTIVGDYTYSSRRDVRPFRMFLHAYRLILPTRVESLDIVTPDPFTPLDPRNKWIPCEYVTDIASAIKELQGSRTD